MQNKLINIGEDIYTDSSSLENLQSLADFLASHGEDKLSWVSLEH